MLLEVKETQYNLASKACQLLKVIIIFFIEVNLGFHSNIMLTHVVMVEFMCQLG